MKRVGDRLRLTMIDLLPGFRAAQGMPYYFRKDPHWNAAGHKLAAHGWSQHIIPASQTEAEEKLDLDRCIAVLAASGGARPHGWISPRCMRQCSSAGVEARVGRGTLRSMVTVCGGDATAMRLSSVGIVWPPA